MTKMNLNVDQRLMLDQQKAVDKNITNIFIAMLLIIPLITRTAIVSHVSPVIGDPILQTAMKADVFTYYKFIFLVIGTLLLIGFFLYKTLAKDYIVSAGYMNLPLALLFLLIACSAVVAPYKSLGLFGQYNRHEGTIAYLCYFAMFFIAANVAYTEKKLRALFYALYPVIIINTVLGLLYFYGVNLLKYSFIQSLILPPEIKASAIKGGSAFNSTLNNPNYVSGIASVFLVLTLVKSLFESSLLHKTIALAMSILSFALLLTSLSTSGFLTFIVLLPIVVILIIAGMTPGHSFATLLVALVLYGGVYIQMEQHNPAVWTNTFGFFAGQKADGTPTSSQVVSTSELAAEISPFALSKVYAADATSPQDDFNLPQPGWSAGTGRTYIWKNTIELIKHRPLLGYGLDTLAYQFPQNDVNKISNLHDATTIVDKPHNMYLGLAFGSGVIALLAFLWLLVRHMWAYLSVLRYRITNEKEKILAALFAGWCAYLIQGLFNDSINGTSLIFWILFGVSVSLIKELNTGYEEEL
ncbi:O-antigen ligase family protein [Aneurinibacillus sp. Ricciae_BoGa-3]|uniref:O-antigen ligase family protein n=1 Tax=Aneurinibacillus sp. Ricciae_BoGa-3 TaxID=3022697 RepID=UPI00233FCFBE|nr:O-antigen ligase family protein [Aneurinibacillus sp. Ricciae_BoGa-3]WCK54282.1 O-antigen ligase family protein [Aneurinibacillus sp. Ricciae_BoGa-3]